MKKAPQEATDLATGTLRKRHPAPSAPLLTHHRRAGNVETEHSHGLLHERQTKGKETERSAGGIKTTTADL